MKLIYDKAALIEYINELDAAKESLSLLRDDTFSTYGSCCQKYMKIYSELEQMARKVYNKMEEAESNYRAAEKKCELLENSDENSYEKQHLEQARIICAEAEINMRMATAEYEEYQEKIKNLQDIEDKYRPQMETLVRKIEDQYYSFITLIDNGNRDLVEYMRLIENAKIALDDEFVTSNMKENNAFECERDKWNAEYMPIVKDNIRKSVEKLFSNYISSEKMEKCLETLCYMDQKELMRRYKARNNKMPNGTLLGYNDSKNSCIANDISGKTNDASVGEHIIIGSGATDINLAFVTAVHENLHMMSANDVAGEIRRGIIVGNDEKLRAMNEAFTEYFTYLSCGGEGVLGGLYPGEYSGYQDLMKEMPIIEKAVGRDCMMDAYFNNAPNQLRERIDSLLEDGAWDCMCTASYDWLYRDSNDGKKSFITYINRLENLIYV